MTRLLLSLLLVVSFQASASNINPSEAASWIAALQGPYLGDLCRVEILIDNFEPSEEEETSDDKGGSTSDHPMARIYMYQVDEFGTIVKRLAAAHYELTEDMYMRKGNFFFILDSAYELTDSDYVKRKELTVLRLDRDGLLMGVYMNERFFEDGARYPDQIIHQRCWFRYAARSNSASYLTAALP